MHKSTTVSVDFRSLFLSKFFIDKTERRETLTLQAATVGHQSRHAEGATVGATGSAAEPLQPGFHENIQITLD